MGLFKPIWESKNRNRIEHFIDRSSDEDKLERTALNCMFPDLRAKAVKRLQQPDRLIAVANEALGRSDRETVISAAVRTSDFEDLTAFNKITDEINDDAVLHDIIIALRQKPNKRVKNKRKDSLGTMSFVHVDYFEDELEKKLFDRIHDDQVLAQFVAEGIKGDKALARIQSRELLLKIGRDSISNEKLSDTTRYVLARECGKRTGDIDLLAYAALRDDTCSSERWMSLYEAVLNDPRFSEAAAKYLAGIEKREHEAAERRKQLEREYLIKKIKDGMANNTEKGQLIREAYENDLPEETIKSLWRLYFKDCDSFALTEIAERISDLPWLEHMPKNALKKMVSACRHFRSESGIVLEELNYVFKTIYRDRKEMRKDVLALDGFLMYEGNEREEVELSDDTRVIEASPSLTLSVKPTEDDSVEVSLIRGPVMNKKTK